MKINLLGITDVVNFYITRCADMHSGVIKQQWCMYRDHGKKKLIKRENYYYPTLYLWNKKHKFWI